MRQGIDSRLQVHRSIGTESERSETSAQSYLAVNQLLFSADREARKRCNKQGKDSALVVTASVNPGGEQISAVIDSGETRHFRCIPLQR